MKSKVCIGVCAVIISIVLAVPIWLSAQGQQPTTGTTYYQVSNLGTLGGSFAIGNGINNIGAVTGLSTLPNGATVRAALWLYGQKFDLGSLGGADASSAVEWPVKNNFGEIVGISETSKIDPSNEGGFSCGAFIPTNGHTCLPFLWRNGAMTALPTLGGNNGFATGINNLGEAVGWAETTHEDPTCQAPQIYQFEATEWGPNPDRARALAPLGNDPDSAATAINDKDQVAGISGICGNAVGAYSAEHAVMWQGGRPRYLGSLGGQGWNTPMAINNLGQIAGFADLPGDTSSGSLIPNFHAFLWTQGAGMKDLGTLPAPYNVFSEATGINDSGQIVGVSCDANFDCVAFLWENGVMMDLNSLVSGNTNLLLISTGDINDQGEITGQACVVSGSVCGSGTVTFLAIPTTSENGNEQHLSNQSVTIPDAIRNQIKQRLGMGAFAHPAQRP